MLDERGVDYRYREYTRAPLEEAELRHVLALLGVAARDVLRRHDRAFKELALTGEESDDQLGPESRSINLPMLPDTASMSLRQPP